MKAFSFKVGTLVLAGLVGCVLSGAPADAVAKTHRGHSYSKTHSVSKSHAKSSRKAKRSSGKEAIVSVRAAQSQLADLGFYTGAIDGKNGAMTRLAIKDFQRAHHMTATGKLDSATSKALAQATYEVRGPGYRPGKTSQGLGGSLGGGAMVDAVAAPVIQGPLGLSSRYGAFDVREEWTPEQNRNFTLSFNGQPIMTVLNQPGLLVTSPTYEVDGEDVVVLTSYTGRENCLYDNNLIVVRADGAVIKHNIPVCVRESTAHVKDGSLFVEFSNGYDGRNTGVTWRYERGTLNPLL